MTKNTYRELYLADVGPAPIDIYGVRAGDKNFMRIEIFAGTDPIDLTGATLLAQARKTPRDSVVALEATITPYDETLGSFDMIWDGEDVRTYLDDEDVDSATLFWDLQVIDAGDTIPVTVAAGRLNLTYDVTREAV